MVADPHEPDDNPSLPPTESMDAPPNHPASIGRYRVEGIIGKGGFGLVFLAHDDQLRRRVAIKVPHRELTSQPADAEAYLSEARALASLDHPHIVPVHDVGSTPDFPCFFVSKYVEGTNLAQHLKQSSISYTEAAELTAIVAEALHYAHKQGLVHRDIKPGNILIDHSGKPYLVDFGLALKEAELGRGPRYPGTPAYMSPEQARGEGHRVDGRSDIYSLGAVLYQMLTGRRTFTVEPRDELLELIATQEPRPPRQLDDRIPKELERICLKALSRRASDRYTTGKDMAEDLRAFVAHSKPAADSSIPVSEEGSGSDHPSPTPRGDSSTLDSDRRPFRIVPKGLRSFDEHDADFFLELLPGPCDRDGLPDSIRFWKTRIEETDPDRTFSVGVIYGPSGCGKTSRMRAGLLPRLSQDVVAVYVECTAQETELRLLNALRRHCPALPSNLGLREMLAAIRRGQGVSFGKKVLIVLDQFEQWLHANWEADHGELVQALRQCDGSQVQCVLMVRDDFWLAVSRFMKHLEIPLVEGHNSALVDLFDMEHASKVLTTFGWAYDRLPDQVQERTGEQRAFVKRVVTDLAQEGKIVCVRLTLFAQMMKSEPWIPSTLKQVGGIEGIGVTFLEETFAATTSPPRHRYHQQAARAVLKALLPESGTNIRGHMRTYADLLEASGYARRAQDLDELLNILDGELRLITPTDPEGVESEEDSAASSSPDRNRYQLTHDYLVPSLREWLTRKQKETRRGRAELRLAERAALWNAKPENRNLPSWWEYLSIRALTKKKAWTESQSNMMRRAGYLVSLRWGAALLVALICGVTIQQVLSHHRADLIEQRRQNDRKRAEALVEAVLTAPPDAVPYAIENLRELREHAIVILRSQLSTEKNEFRHRVNAALALASLGQVETQFLSNSIARTDTRHCANILSALRKSEDPMEDALRGAAREAESQQDWHGKARVAIIAMHLGFPYLAKEMFQLRPDPIQRTVLIDTFESWHGDIADLVPIVTETSDATFRSGICLALGNIADVDLSVRSHWENLLKDWYTRQPDPGTHSAAGWILRRWEVVLPGIQPTTEPVNGRQWYVNSVGMTMLCMPKGRFVRRDDLRPDAKAQEVTLTSPFFLSDREVSVELFLQFVDDEICEHEKLRERKWIDLAARTNPTTDHPVTWITWFDAIKFCNWLSRREEREPCYKYLGEATRSLPPENMGGETWEFIPAANGYRLPSEGEWEYACRAVSETSFSFGDDASFLTKYAVFASMGTEAVGSKLPNAWGLFDVHGNVLEWCQDWYGEYGEEAVNDPWGASVGSYRIGRGGAWSSTAGYCRSAYRNWRAPFERFDGRGFRVARNCAE